VTCHGDEPGKLDTKSFTASGLSKITLPNGCSAETDTHIFAAADDGFDRAKTDYIVVYVWPFDPLTLTPGLDTKKFSEILRRNLTNLAPDEGREGDVPDDELYAQETERVRKYIKLSREERSNE
jgi:hypothetical protein